MCIVQSATQQILLSRATLFNRDGRMRNQWKENGFQSCILIFYFFSCFFWLSPGLKECGVSRRSDAQSNTFAPNNNAMTMRCRWNDDDDDCDDVMMLPQQ